MAAFTCCRKAFLAIAILQMLTIFERQVLDFMGYMWLCIALNFLHVICIILAIFGALQYRVRYVVLGIVWNLLWVGWNSLVICIHLDVGLLNKDMQILNLGTGTLNWWMVNGPGCVVTYDFSTVDPVTFRAKVARVDNCLLAYEYIEVIHSSLQILLSILCAVAATILAFLYRRKSVSSLDDVLKPQPLPGYTLSLQHSVATDNIEIAMPRPPAPTMRNGTYDQVSKKTRESMENGTTISGRSCGSSTRRKSTARTSQDNSAAFVPKHGVDNIRVSSMIPKNIHADLMRDPNGTSVYGAYGVAPPKPPSPVRRPYTCYNPGSVSPYPSRAANEASF